ncbi:hypothetical protein HanHA89_Chr10g0388341 [Helianthus annuus]|nr:hypothetical protein HanHA89_Chr10g0388341 [Helianthus annuus]
MSQVPIEESNLSHEKTQIRSTYRRLRGKLERTVTGLICKTGTSLGSSQDGIPPCDHPRA